MIFKNLKIIFYSIVITIWFFSINNLLSNCLSNKPNYSIMYCAIVLMILLADDNKLNELNRNKYLAQIINKYKD